MEYSQWEIKQIIDVVSKGVNSVLMNEKSPTPLNNLRTLALNLTEIYEQILNDLKNKGDKTPAWADKIPKKIIKNQLYEEAGKEYNEQTKVEIPTINADEL